MRKILSLLAAGTLTLLAVGQWSARAAETSKTYPLQSGRKSGDIDRIVQLLEVGGEVKGMADGKVQREKMSVECKLGYDEKTLEVPTGAAGRWRSVRYYDKAAAVVKVGKVAAKPALRSQRRLIGVEIDSQTATLFSPQGTLARDELDLIDSLGNSLLVDRFLPEKPVALGGKWKHSNELMAALLGLDEVAEGDVASVLSSVDDATARIEMAGSVTGAVNGVSTEIELMAKYRFDLKRKRIDWFALLVKERRDIGHVADGVDAVARVQLKISPRADSARLAEAALKNLPTRSTPELRRLTYKSSAGDWQLSHDRCWHVTGDRPELAIFGMIDRGEYVAQCKVSPLPDLASGKQATLDEFRSDVRKALGKHLGQFVSAGQQAHDAGYRVYRVVARGEASGLPIQWDYHLVAEERGRRLVFAFTVEKKLAERFQAAGRKLVNSLRFLDRKSASAKPAGG